ncbi:MAG: pilus assembly protein N-terminal domain-containing protein, partial [Aestuariivirga sp.]
MVKRFLIAAGIAASMSFAAAHAQSMEQLVVKADQTQVITLPGNPGVVVVGNPSMADATVAGNQVFVHGKLFGTTNIIILDVDGNQMAAFEVTVMRPAQSAMVMYKGGSAFSYVCAPD